MSVQIPATISCARWVVERSIEFDSCRAEKYTHGPSENCFRQLSLLQLSTFFWEHEIPEGHKQETRDHDNRGCLNPLMRIAQLVDKFQQNNIIDQIPEGMSDEISRAGTQQSSFVPEGPIPVTDVTEKNADDISESHGHFGLDTEVGDQQVKKVQG